MEIANQKRVCKKWSSKEIEYLKENYSKQTNKELAIHFETTISSIKSCAIRFKLRKPYYTMQKASEQKEKLQRVYEQKIDVHADMLRFANSLEKGMKHRRLGPVFNKYGYYKFKTMYQIHTA